MQQLANQLRIPNEEEEQRLMHAPMSTGVGVDDFVGTAGGLLGAEASQAQVVQRLERGESLEEKCRPTLDRVANEERQDGRES